MAQQSILMVEDDIRGLNIDFNYNNYGVFYEKLEEEKKGGADDKQSNGDDERPKGATNAATSTPVVGFQKLISEKNLLMKMWQNVEVDLEGFQERYEDWLEEEVWTYYD